MDVNKLQHYLQTFANERDWNQYHNPKNLAMALAGECGELLEIFQWLKPEESTLEKLGPENMKAVKDEVADVFIYLVRMAGLLKIDLEEAFWSKMEKNAKKYPAEQELNRKSGFNR